MKKIALAAALAGLFAATTAQAYVIDNFTTSPAINLSQWDVGVGNTVNGSADAANILGGYHNVTINQTLNGDPNVSRTLALTNISGYFSASNDDGVDSTVTVTWNANGAGLGGADIVEAANTGFYIRLLNADLNVVITFTAVDTAANSSTAFINFPAAVTNEDRFVTFASFGGSTNFASLNSLSMTLDGPAAWDARIALLRTQERPPSVPEPATLGLLGLGLLGLGAMRRRRG